MHRTVTCTLRATPDDTAKLLRAQIAFNDACNTASAVAFQEGIFNKVRLHHRVYYQLRTEHGLLSQFAVRAIHVVADAYKADHAAQRRFRGTAALVYDERLYRIEPKGGYQRVSLATLDGRIVCALAIGGYQRAWLGRATKIGQADVYQDHKKRWRIAFAIELPDIATNETEGVLGVDLGIAQLAVTSDGEAFTGAIVNGLRIRRRRLRAKLQKHGTRNAKRRLRRIGDRERRMQADTNHVISKLIVRRAADTHRAIALEDLNGITKRLLGKVSRGQRQRLGGWAFSQLTLFLAYKAAAAGVRVVTVNPAYTSQTCPDCGCVAAGNRPSQSRFLCIDCGFAGHADHVAAVNIAVRGRAVVMQPNASPQPVGVDASRST